MKLKKYILVLVSIWANIMAENIYKGTAVAIELGYGETNTSRSDESSAASISTSKTCDYIDNSATFTCSSRGRYRNPNDPSCRTYYLCNQLKNGSFVQTLYTCPKTSFFNPPGQVCDVNYKCPCGITTSTTILITTSEESITETEAEESLTTEEATTEREPDGTSTSASTTLSTTDMCDYIDDSAIFTCSSKGRYQNPNDPSCQTYYLCNQLKNGSFVQTLYTCPKTSFFNPPGQVCDVNYKCPCGITTSTIILTTTSEESITETEAEESLTTEEATTEREPDGTSTSASTTFSTTDMCDYIDDSAIFTCSSKGRYRNPNDPSCQTYYLCNQLKNGSFVQTLYTCPTTSFFNPPGQVCDVNYKCPCGITTSTTILITTSEESITETKAEESLTTEEATTEREPDGTSTSASTTLSTTYMCNYIDDSAIFTCSSKGRYQNPNDPSCQTYYLCNQLKNGSFVQTLYTCPKTSFFNPPGQVCDVNYKCPCGITTSTIILTTTSEESITETEAEESLTTEEATTEREPDGTSTSASTTFSTTDMCDYIDDSAIFTCSSKGRYRNPNDPSCQTYYLCNQLKNGSFVQTLYTCPTTSFFNPPGQVCDVNYKCPCGITTSTTILITTSEESITKTEAEESLTTEEATTEREPDGTSTSASTTLSTTDMCDYIDDSAIFTCSSKGRYHNPNDPSCQTYYLCNQLKNGSFVQTLYTCPKTSFFNPPGQVCDVNYKCPCGITTSTIILTTTSEESITETEAEESLTTEEATTEREPDGTSTSASTTFSTTDMCDYIDDSAIFTCSSKGRYRNPNDPSCQTYYLCNQLKNGSFVQTLYTCPTTSFFNPPGQVCDVNYKCPCGITTSTTILITTSEESITETEAEESLTTKEATTEREPDGTSTSASTTLSTTDMCDYIDDSAIFTCSSKGRYQNPNDPSCQTYYLCNQLKNGSFVQTLYTCPKTSFFNPPGQVCDVNYKCPCGITTSTIILTTTSEESITETEAEESLTTGEATTEREPDGTSTSASTTFSTTDMCDYIDDSAIFTCSSKGRYRNPNDPSCQTYYLCNQLKNGSFVQTLYTCPTTSFFNPPGQVCDVNYKCPCGITTSTTILITTSEESITKTEAEESLTTEEATTKREPDGTSTSASTTFSTTDMCNYIDDSAIFTCSSKGRYQNPNDPSCQTYYLCNQLKNGSFVQTLYTCPTTSFFNPPGQVCDVNYKCPCGITTSTTILTTTSEESITETEAEESVTTEEATTEREPDGTSTSASTTFSTTDMCDYIDDSAIFTCSSKGRYQNPNDPSCQTYYLCNQLKNGSFVQTLYTCPTTSFFNPPGQVCDVNYKCPCGITTSTTILTTTSEESITETEAEESLTTEEATTERKPDGTSTSASTKFSTTDMCDYIDDSAIFTCSSKGRYRNPNDPSCQTYYLCNQLKNGSFVQTLYTCPTTSFFNPPGQVCDVNYKCPCAIPTSTTILITTSEESITETEAEESLTTEEATTEREPDGTSTSASTTFSTTDMCDYIDDSAVFTCSNKGRYRNPNDPSCQTYYLCNHLKNGSFVQTLYTCPTTSFFNPPRQVCDVNYKCPCAIPTSTTILTTTSKEPITETEAEESLTTEKATTDRKPDGTSTSASTTFSTTDMCDYINDSAIFTCSNKGRYRNPNDPSCQTYYLCNHLKNGSFVQTLYTCPITSFFNPPRQVCDINYKCPCAIPTSTTILTTTSKEPITETEAEESLTTEKATTDRKPDGTSTSASTTFSTTDMCDYINDSAIFTCSNKGRYRNPNDPSCQTYYLCNHLKNGSFVQTLYTCPITSFFNPPRQVCDINYKCPCAIPISTTILTTTSKEPITETEAEESLTTEEATTEREPDGTSTSASTTFSTTDMCDYIDDSAIFTCSSKGRYQNPIDPSCQTYYLCNQLKNGSFVQTLYTCPTTSFFNPPGQVCDVNYKCPCGITTSTTILTKTSEESITETEAEESVTTEEATTEREPDGTSISASTTFSTTDMCDYIDDSAIFTCSSKGRYRNPNDPSCQTYYLCNQLKNGSFVQTLYTCPTTSFFNPPGQVCDVNYKCPCGITTSTTILTTTSEESITETEAEESLTTEEATTEREPDGTSTSASTTFSTTDMCDYIDDSAVFTCSNKGRYRNPNDPSCQTYYLCNHLKNGSFVQTLYTCPTTSFFNPPRQVCDVNYKCPCAIPTSTTILTTTSKEPITETEAEESLTTEKATTEREPDGTSTSASTTFSTTDMCDYIDDSAIFTCSSKGRYQNPIDPSCQTYYLCNQLKNGSFVQTLYTCPTTSFFNPPGQVCDVNYKCPCGITTSTTILTKTSEESITETEAEESVTTEEATTEREPDGTSISASTTFSTTDMCDYIDDSAIFTCSSKGRYRNPIDPSCQTYYLCNQLKNGSFVQTLYTCPKTSFFNPPGQVCDVNYKCPCGITTSTIILTTTSEESITETEAEESLTTGEATTEREPDGTSTSASTTFSTTDMCDYIDDSAIFTCSSKGRYRNPNDPSCQTYYLCNQLKNGSFVQTLYTCPTTSFFNPPGQVCDVNYKCPCGITTSTTILITTSEESITKTEAEESLTTEEATTKREPDGTSTSASTTFSTTDMCNYIDDSAIFTCSSKGRYQNPNDPSCQTYYLCNQLKNGSFVQTLYTCPTTSFFNPPGQVCDVNYKCPCGITTSTTILTTTSEESITETEAEESVTTEEATTEREPDGTSTSASTTFSTTDMCDYIDDSAIFTCSSKGRYQNPNDPSCQTYYLCNQLKNGSFVQTLYTCPTTSFFNPPGQVCDVNYKCPCGITTSTTILTTTSEESITETEAEESLTTEEATTERKPDGTSTSASTKFSTTDMCDYIDDSAIFTCSSKGRYRNPNDPSCQTYYLCNQLKNGSFVQTLYTCPTTSFFNPPGQVCDVNYKCPCAIPTSTTILITTSEESITETEAEESLTTEEATTEREPDGTSTSASTTFSTTDMCDYIDDSAVFTCSNKGRYRNPNDPSCQTYYLCNHLKNGSFVQTLYTCPTTSFFNPPRQVCDVNYKCPCAIPTSTTILTTTSKEPITETEAEESLTTEKATTDRKPDGTSTSASTTFSTTDMCDYINDSAIFTCSNKGRYRNPNDPSCQTYYLCNHLKNGSFVQTLYTCPITSFFNPPRQVCDINYKCPCAIPTSTTILTTTSKEPITETEAEESLTTEKATTDRKPDGTSTSASTTFSTTDMCDYINDSAIFTCSNKGRYRNPNDPSCQTYYLCNHLKNGSFVQTLYTCPITSFFNPPRQVCDINYKCPCAIPISTTILTTTSKEPITETEAEESLTTEEATTEREPDGTSTSASTTFSTTDMCDYIDDSAIFTCSSKGRYQNPIDPSCQTYYLCNQLKNGSFVQTLYTCPTTSFFNPPGQVCDVNYKCPCGITTSTTILTKTSEESITETEAEESVTTEEATTEREPDGTSISASTTFSTTDMCDYIDDSAIFTCSSKGRYRNPNDPSCQTYYLCNQLKNGSFVQTLYTCPTTSFFNPPGQVCDVNYKCPCGITTSTTILTTTSEESITETEAEESLTTEEATTEREPDGTSTSASTTFSTTDMCDYIDDSAVFTCSNKGRYRNPNDPSCQTYYLCNHLKNGSFVQTLYTCPTTSFFNPPRQVCDVNYKCPCAIPTSTTILTTTSKEPITETEAEESLTTEKATTEREPDGTSTSASTTFSTTDMCDYIDDSAIFTCSSKGRYQNPIDPSCQTYYLCNQLKNGSFVQTLYTCPTTSFFNPPGQVCDVNYKCPCGITTSTTILTKTSEESITETEAEESVTTEEATTEREPDGTSISASTTFSTTDMCDYIDDSAIFTCSSKGRYRNPIDPSCQTYYLCNQLKNGSFVQTLYTCPTTSFFNPPGQVCDVNYKCPCAIPTSTTILITTSEELITETEAEESLTTEEATTEREPDGTSTSASTTFSTTDMCDYIDDSAIFTCSSKGRYRNSNDPSCQTYYLCNQLKNGSFVQTLYTCPTTSFFNPPGQVCDVNYKCPCAIPTSTTILTTTSKEPITETEAEESLTTGEATTDREPDGTSTSASTTLSTTDMCNYIDDSAIFTCSSKGRYRNPNDPSCQTYYLCNQLKNGSFVQTLYTCPTTSFFNPPGQVCDVHYKCPCAIPTSTTILTTMSKEPITETEAEESLTTEEATTEREPDGTSISVFTSTSTTDMCDYINYSAIFTCSSKGRYRNPNDPSCQTYYLCNQLKNGSFVQTLYTCPTTSFFNPPGQVCDVNYKCPCAIPTSTTILTTTSKEPITETEAEESLTTEEATTERESDGTSISASTSLSTTDMCDYIDNSAVFTCSSKGRYRNQNDPSCQTYYLCNQLKNGSFVQTLYTCPTTSFFNPPGQVCDVHYKCPCAIPTSTTILTTMSKEPITETEAEESLTTEEATTEREPDGTSISVLTSSSTTDMCDYINYSAIFTCSSKGRYRNPNDPFCQTYYLCNQLKNGSFVQTLYTCPTTSFFNPPGQVCDVNYKCPCAIPTSTTILTTTSKEPITETEAEESLTTEEATTEREPNETSTSASTSLSTTDMCNYIDDSAVFTCSSKGRYRNPNDPSCQTYYLCNQLKNGSFVQTLYTCPTTSSFNIPGQVCDVNYKCPCVISTSTTILTTTSKEPITETEAEESLTTEEATTERESDGTSISASTSLFTTDMCDYIDNSAVFTCSSKGRYRNQNDPSCQTYYLCNQLKNGSFVQTLYTCPTTSFFNPPGQVCDVHYKCPCAIPTSTTILTTMSKEPITETEAEESLTTEEATTEREPDGTSISVLTSSSTTDMCDYINYSAIFTCSSKGRYRNPNDPSCQTYYFCNQLKNGSFVQTLYTCPTTSFFNPLGQVCDVNYKCPCIITTSTSILTTTSEEPITETEAEEFLTTEEATTERESDGTSTFAPTSLSPIDMCEYIDDSAIFTCSSKGRYQNPNDPSCQTYYLCNQLKNGSFVQTLYTCPTKSFFNPPGQVCDINYKCPCVRTTTTIMKTSKEELTTVIESEDFSVTENAWTKRDIDESEFTCPSTGIFKDIYDLGCRRFYICIRSFLTYLSIHLTCPQDTNFDPLLRLCSPFYSCPHSYQPLNDGYIQEITNSEPIKITDFWNNESTGSTRTSSTPFTIQPITKKHLFKESSSSENVTASEYTEPTSPSTDIHESNFACSSSGIFGHYEDMDCKRFYVCIRSFSTYISIQLTCPEGTFFDPFFHSCSPLYFCPHPPLSAEVESKTTKPTTFVSKNDESISICPTTGIFEDINDPICKSYYMCISTFSSYLVIHSKCPSGTFFDPSFRLCSPVYSCPHKRTPTTVTYVDRMPTTNKPETTGHSTDPSKFTEEPFTESGIVNIINTVTKVVDSDFTCPSTGVFEDIKDLSCRKFYICMRFLSSYSLIHTTCPEGTFFDPLFSSCSPFHFCSYSPDETTKTNYQTVTATKDIAGPTEFPEGVSSDASLPEMISSIITNKNAIAALTMSPISTETELTSIGSNTTVKSNTPLGACTFNGDAPFFTCISSGRYPNVNDATCKTYYLCTLWRNDIFRQKVHICPLFSYFNPIDQVCDMNYKCPCRIERRKREITGDDITNKTQEEQAKMELDDYGIGTMNLTLSVEFTELCIYDKNVPPFNCISSGRYPNINDPTCRTYQLCVKLRNGLFSQSQYKCPRMSHFNPIKRVCDSNYKCPCRIKRRERAITEDKTTSITQMEQAKIKLGKSEIDTMDLTLPVNFTELCINSRNVPPFSCINSGRYPNINDPTCRTYQLCVKLRSGLFSQSQYKCPRMSHFNPIERVCDSNYKCPCRIKRRERALTEDETTSITQMEQAKIKLGKSEIDTMDLTLPVDFTELCINSRNAPPFSCIKSGRYPNINDPTCRTYQLCVKLRSGLFSQSQYKCPRMSHFNPIKRVCDSNYKCPCRIKRRERAITEDKTTSITQMEQAKIKLGKSEIDTMDLTLPVNFTELCINSRNVPPFSCINSGRYPNINDPTCRTYQLCVKLRSGLFSQSQYKCPRMSHFNPIKRVCDSNYKCPCRIKRRERALTEDETTSITQMEQAKIKLGKSEIDTMDLTLPVDFTELCINSRNAPPFSCIKSGRYPNINDPTCRTYQLCVKLRSGLFSQSQYKCPRMSHFNPIKRVCDSNYKCPCRIKRRERAITEDETTSITQMEQAKIKRGKSEIDTMDLTLPVDFTELCVNSRNAPPFSCINSGRYPNINDPTCRTYQLCVKLRNGLFSQSQYKCPRMSYFNPIKRVCDSNYKCPCKIKRRERAITEDKTTIITQMGQAKIKFNKSEIDAFDLSSPVDFTESCIYAKDAILFSCISSGRYPNINDPTCRTYQLCVKLRNGLFIQSQYKCPRMSLFNPIKRVCDTNYKCSCKINRRERAITEDETTSLTQMDQAKIKIDKSEIDTVDLILPVDFTQLCIYSRNAPPFSCINSGRYPNINDPTCRTYQLCVKLRSGLFSQSQYKCPRMSHFNPIKRVCDSNYKCPCRINRRRRAITEDENVTHKDQAKAELEYFENDFQKKLRRHPLSYTL